MRDFDPTASEFISSGYLKDSRPGGRLFDFMSIAAIAAPIVGGMFGADAAGKAADQQAASGREANATIREAQARAEKLLSPYVQSGNQYNALLQRYMGIGPKGGPGSANYQQLYDANRAGTIARGADVNDPNYERNLQLEIDAAMRNQPGGIDDPMYGSLLKPFDQTDLDKDLVYQNGLQFGLDTGINQLNNRAAAAGGYGSGAALKALTRFGNDYATTKTGDAYNRNSANKNQIYSFISGQSAAGQNAAAGLGASGMSAAGQIAGNQTGIGNAQAAGTVGAANAVSNGLAGATNAYQWNQLLNKGKSGSNYAMSEPYSGFNSLIGLGPQ